MTKDLEERVEIPEGLKKFIALEGKEISVNWEGLFKLDVEAREGSQNERLHNACLGELVKLGILSTESDGNFRIMGGGINLGPTRGFSEYFFTREEDAIAYKDARYKGALYPVSIEQVRVVS